MYLNTIRTDKSFFLDILQQVWYDNVKGTLHIEREEIMARKTYTSTDVKRRYNERVYTHLSYQLPKDLVAKFKDKCEAMGVSQASIIREAIENFIAEK